jgi:hypothetical protein
VNGLITEKLKYPIHLIEKMRERKGVGVGGRMVEKIYCWDTGTLYIVHSPSSTETATRLEQMFRESLREISEDLGIDITDVMRLNTGNDVDREILERILSDEDCFEVEI